MANITDGVKDIVKDGLVQIPKPYPIDVTFQLALLIEGDADLLRRYKEEIVKLGISTTNQALGSYARKITGLKSGKQVNTSRKTIISSFTELHH